MSRGARPAHVTPTVAIVVVTFNRADLLERLLDSLAALSPAADAVFVVDNASTDRTPAVLEAFAGRLPLQVLTSPTNTGGAGGFHLGVKVAYEAGYDKLWLMDDDVVPRSDCLGVLRAHQGPCQMAVREDLQGKLCEKSAVRFDLRNPLAVRPKRAAVDQRFSSREQMPVAVAVENVAFEGFMVDRRVIDQIGLPDRRFFIFYDDVDYALRARRAGFPIVALRDAVLVRQLDFNQQHDMTSWKGFYMYRNLFLVHLWYGENVLVRLKPWAITLAVLLLVPLRRSLAEARNVLRALADAREIAATGPARAGHEPELAARLATKPRPGPARGSSPTVRPHAAPLDSGLTNEVSPVHQGDVQ